MNKVFNAQMLAAVLRALTLGGRFFLLFYLATKLDLVQMGIFSLYWAGLQLSASLIPLDVYAQTTRLILAKGNEVGGNLERHFGFLLLAIAFLAPVAIFLNISFGGKFEGLLLFILIIHLPLEVYATDLCRLLVPLGKPLLSNFCNFLRAASWILPVFAIFELNIAEISPATVVILWFLGTFLAVFVALRFSKLESLRLLSISVDFRWIKAAIGGSFIFLIATLMFRSILGVDKFLVNAAYGEEVVGIYVVYAAGVLGVLALLESGISAWHYPGMVQSIRLAKLDLAKRQFKRFFWQNLFITILLFLGLFIFFPLASYLFLPKVYFDEIALFYILSVGVVFYCLTMPFHYVIYGYGRDFYFVTMYFISLLSMIVWYFSYMKDFGINGAGIMLSGALLVISMLRVLFSVMVISKISLAHERAN